MQNLKQIRLDSGLARIRVAHLAEVSAYRLWQAEEGMIELKPDERERVNKILAPAYQQKIRSAMDFVQQREAATVNA